jgi:hypothetical protein
MMTNGNFPPEPQEDDLIAYDAFVIPHEDGKFEWRIQSTDGRNWSCFGYATEDEASIAAMQYIQSNLLNFL